MAERLKYFVGGEWLTSSTDEWYEITNSSTGEVMAEAPRCTTEEVDAAVTAAKAAYPAWRDTPLPERVQVMFRLKAKLDENLHDLSKLLATEEDIPGGFRFRHFLVDRRPVKGVRQDRPGCLPR